MWGLCGGYGSVVLGERVTVWDFWGVLGVLWECCMGVVWGIEYFFVGVY